MASATKQALLAALSAAQGECISGQQLAQQLGVSRAAVHKAAAALADKLGCREAVFRTAGGTQPFGMAKSLDGTPLPRRAYLGPTFE